MKMIISSKQDILNLQGKFIIAIDHKEPDRTLMNFDWPFAKEKRLRFVAGRAMVGMFGYIYDYETEEKFVEVFNGEKRDRFYRLLTSRELEYLCEQMKKENY